MKRRRPCVRLVVCAIVSYAPTHVDVVPDVTVVVMVVLLVEYLLVRVVVVVVVLLLVLVFVVVAIKRKFPELISLYLETLPR